MGRLLVEAISSLMEKVLLATYIGNALAVFFTIVAAIGFFRTWPAGRLFAAISAATLAYILGHVDLERLHSVDVSPGRISLILEQGNRVVPTLSLPDDTSARIEVSGCKREQQDGAYVVTAVIGTLSKFQRSGVVLRWKSPKLIKVDTLAPLNEQPTVAQPYSGPTDLYIQRPWGQYQITLRSADEQPIQFKYQFEGDDEIPGTAWCAN